MSRGMAIASLAFLAAALIVAHEACTPSIPPVGKTQADASDSGYVTITVSGYDAGMGPGY